MSHPPTVFWASSHGGATPTRAPHARFMRGCAIGRLRLKIKASRCIPDERKAVAEEGKRARIAA